MKAGYDSEITLALQKSTNGRTWSNVASWTGSGSEKLTKSRFVTSGYDYRCKLTVKVYNSSGNYVTTYTQYSDHLLLIIYIEAGAVGCPPPLLYMSILGVVCQMLLEVWGNKRQSCF